MSEASEHPIVVAPLQTQFFALPEGVRLVEPTGISPGITFPEGFVASGVVAGLKQSGRLDMGVVAVTPKCVETAASAHVSTTNAFAAAPVLVTRTETQPGGIVAVAINSGNANACTGENGLHVARAMQRACAQTLSLPQERTAVASTGIIGVQLDADVMAKAVAGAAAAVDPDGGPAFAQAIMTTDRFAKECALDVTLPNGSVRLAACAKGAGMIAPALATMLCVVTTDAVLDTDQTQALLLSAVQSSFNRVTVDGEMSTNDAVFLLASGASGIHPDGPGLVLFTNALHSLLHRLALMMVADGEGSTKIMRVRVHGADDETTAARVCRAIADSPLVKTAMHGGDPNWGRILSSAGAALPGRSLPETSLHLCSVKVVEGASLRDMPEAEQERLAAGMKEREIDIDLDLGVGEGQAELYFADLGHEYITINAEYHT